MSMGSEGFDMYLEPARTSDQQSSHDIGQKNYVGDVDSRA